MLDEIRAPIAICAKLLARNLMEKVVGPEWRPMPTARSRTSWLATLASCHRQPTRGPVVFFHGCAGGY